MGVFGVDGCKKIGSTVAKKLENHVHVCFSLFYQNLCDTYDDSAGLTVSLTVSLTVGITL